MDKFDTKIINRELLDVVYEDNSFVMATAKTEKIFSLYFLGYDSSISQSVDQDDLYIISNFENSYLLINKSNGKVYSFNDETGDIYPATSILDKKTNNVFNSISEGLIKVLFDKLSPQMLAYLVVADIGVYSDKAIEEIKNGLNSYPRYYEQAKRTVTVYGSDKYKQQLSGNVQESKRKTYRLTESQLVMFMENAIKNKPKTVFYEFQSNTNKFITEFIKDPINTKLDGFLVETYPELKKKDFVKKLEECGILVKEIMAHESTMSKSKVKYSLPKAEYYNKAKRLFKELEENKNNSSPYEHGVKFDNRIYIARNVKSIPVSQGAVDNVVTYTNLNEETKESWNYDISDKLKTLRSYLHILNNVGKDNPNYELAKNYFTILYNYLIIERGFYPIVVAANKEINKYLDLEKLNTSDQVYAKFLELYNNYSRIRTNVETFDNIEEIRKYIYNKRVDLSKSLITNKGYERIGLNEDNQKIGFDSEIEYELERYLQNTVWGKTGETKKRANQLIDLHRTFIEKANDKFSAEEIAKKLFVYEKNMLGESIHKRIMESFYSKLNKSNILTEELSKADIKDEFEKYINSNNTLSVIKDEVIKTIGKSKEVEDKMVEIAANVLVQLYKSLWTKRGFWRSDLKNLPS